MVPSKQVERIIGLESSGFCRYMELGSPHKCSGPPGTDSPSRRQPFINVAGLQNVYQSPM